MPDDVPRLPWADEQWAALQRIVQDAAAKARVASSFLPLVGPLAPGQASVPELVMFEDEFAAETYRLAIDDAPTVPLVTAECLVYLTTQQVEDPELSSAKQLLGRAADVVGRLEDLVVFNGENPEPALAGNKFYSLHIAAGSHRRGLLNWGGASELSVEEKEPAPTEADPHPIPTGEHLVAAVVGAINEIEEHGHYGPFACVLGRDLYQAANTPNASLVLPSDRITSFLDGGPLRRSSVLPDDRGVVIGLAGAPVDLVVASDVHVKFLQLTLEPRYVLRVSERFVLRVKQPKAICTLKAYAKK
ncbi:MAG TPA: family 1 encapsulin nanocompartment shell protein [Acidimicrobiia bacterium]|nr:family 1 encapsulin nanocompartment shell protein [Acidimicrobiia bacterium]